MSATNPLWFNSNACNFVCSVYKGNKDVEVGFTAYYFISLAFLINKSFENKRYTDLPRHLCT